MKIINVGVGELAVSASPDVLKTILGSCVGIAIYSPRDKVGGLLHIMLPRLNNGDMNKTKYANSGIPELITIIEGKYGVNRRHMVAKIAGGANMFSFKKTAAPLFDIGPNNITAVRYCLNELNIPIIGEDVGLNYGRRVEFHIESGRMVIVGPNTQAIDR
ncbi:MAG TPA: chemotaxis protein CheD [Nitrospirota bacterium]|nr:chemotaxis protein CheD [Nitrospirota bacterium]